MSAESTRPVWLTREQRDVLVVRGCSFASDAWDAAPADAVEAGTRAVAEHFRAYETEDREDGLIEYREGTRAVLRALGMPDACDHSDLPPNLLRVLRDQSVVIGQDAAVFDVIAQWAKAPSNTASADLSEEQS